MNRAVFSRSALNRPRRACLQRPGGCRERNYRLLSAYRHRFAAQISRRRICTATVDWLARPRAPSLDENDGSEHGRDAQFSVVGRLSPQQSNFAGRCRDDAPIELGQGFSCRPQRCSHEYFAPCYCSRRETDIYVMIALRHAARTSRD